MVQTFGHAILGAVCDPNMILKVLCKFESVVHTFIKFKRTGLWSTVVIFQ